MSRRSGVADGPAPWRQLRALCVRFHVRRAPYDRYDQGVQELVSDAGGLFLSLDDVALEAIQTAAAALNAMPDQTERAMETLAGLCARHRVTG